MHIVVHTKSWMNVIVAILISVEDIKSIAKRNP